MLKSSLLTLSTVVAALSAAASAQAGFVYDSAVRTNSLTSPAGTVGASSSVLGDFLDFRNYSIVGVSGSAQHGSTLAGDSMSFGAFVQLFSNAAGFAGPLFGSATADVYFRSTTSTVIALGVNTNSQSAGVSSTSNAAVSLVATPTNTTLYSTSVNDSSSVELTLVAGTLYRLQVSNYASISSGTGNALSNFSVSISTVPAPGAIVAFGLAGLASRRRR